MFRLAGRKAQPKLSQPPKMQAASESHRRRDQLRSAVIPWAAASDSKGRQTQHRLKAPPKAEDARSTPGHQHHGICETRIYTGGGPPGSASVFFSSCLALHRHFHSAASFLGKTDKRVRNKTPTASVSLNPPCRRRRCGAWHAVESSS